ncbi:MAG: PD-(D/E)XK nuclease family protein [Chloroflexi bacterium]|nr:MAG: PD-(D/E)XK nuclease family protein [Chloroflexota bacterium]
MQAPGGAILEGFIDLLVEDGDGLRVVDYKTDQVALKEVDERFAGYRLQGAAYALLAAGVTGRPVTRVDFVFTDSGEVRSLAGAELAVQVAEIRTRLERAPGEEPSGGGDDQLRLPGLNGS